MENNTEPKEEKAKSALKESQSSEKRKEIQEPALVLLTEWKNRLGLQDWKIILTDNVDPEDMVMEGSTGTATYEESIKAASIQIVNPAKLGGLALRPFDYEETLVHELLHLKLCLLQSLDTAGTNTLQDRLVHQILDDLARALVDAKRKGRDT